MTIVTIGIDLAKNIFAVHIHNVDATGKPALAHLREASFCPELPTGAARKFYQFDS